MTHLKSFLEFADYSQDCMLRGTARFVSTGVALAVTRWLAPVLAQSAEPARGATPEPFLFEGMPVMEAAFLPMQALEEAPASIPILPAEDARKYS